MTRYPSARGRGIGQDEQSRRCSAEPAGALARNDKGTPGLHIVGSEHLFDRCQLSLDLDHQYGGRRGMPGEDIDGATIRVDRERDLGPDGPAGPLQHRDRPTHQGSVAFVEQPIDVAAPPTQRDSQVSAELLGDRFEHAESRAINQPALDHRHEVLAHPGGCSEVLLAEALSDPQRANAPAESSGVHLPDPGVQRLARNHPAITARRDE